MNTTKALSYVLIPVLVAAVIAGVYVTQSDGNSSTTTPTTSTLQTSSQGTPSTTNTITVTEIIGQETIYSQRACTESIGVSNSTTYIAPSNTGSSQQSGVTVTTTEVSNYTTTTVLSPPIYSTNVANGTTITIACG